MAADPRLVLAVVLLVASSGLAGGSQGGAGGDAASGASATTQAQAVLVRSGGAAATLTPAETDLAALLAAGGRPLPARVTGRVLPLEGTATGVRHQWPGVYAQARFGGDALVAAFDDPFNRYRVTLDGGAGPEILVTRPGRRALRLSGLGAGPHEVRIDKISEVQSGVGAFVGFVLPRGGEALPPPPAKARQIEIVGDSDSVGYGNTSATRDCQGDDVFLLTDTQEAFGPRVARHFDADYQLIAASGVRLVRDPGAADPDWTMGRLYPQALFEDAGGVAPDGWAPRIVLLALGSNDFASPGPGDQRINRAALRAEFEARYLSFLHDLRATHRDAFFLLVAWEEYGRDYMAAHRSILDRLRAGGEARADLLVLPEMERTGCHWHPSLDDHRSAARRIIAYIEARPALWAN